MSTSKTSATKTSSAFRMVCAIRTTIAASPDRVWALLTDGAGFPRWNSTVTPFARAMRRTEARLADDSSHTREVLTTDLARLQDAQAADREAARSRAADLARRIDAIGHLCRELEARTVIVDRESERIVGAFFNPQ